MFEKMPVIIVPDETITPEKKQAEEKAKQEAQIILSVFFFAVLFLGGFATIVVSTQIRRESPVLSFLGYFLGYVLYHFAWMVWGKGNLGTKFRNSWHQIFAKEND